MLVCNWTHSDWTKSLVCKDAFQQGFRYSEVFQRFCTVCKSRNFGSLPTVRTKCHPVRTLICPQFQSFERRAIPSGRPTNQVSFIRTTCISIRTLHYIVKLLFQLAFVRTSQQPVQTTSSDRSATYFLSKFK
jgi:hypothetical protein